MNIKDASECEFSENGGLDSKRHEGRGTLAFEDAAVQLERVRRVVPGTEYSEAAGCPTAPALGA